MMDVEVDNVINDRQVPFLEEEGDFGIERLPTAQCEEDKKTPPLLYNIDDPVPWPTLVLLSIQASIVL